MPASGSGLNLRVNTGPPKDGSAQSLGSQSSRLMDVSGGGAGEAASFSGRGNSSAAQQTSSGGRSESSSSGQFPCSKLKLDQLFLQWLSLPESQTLVLGLLEDAKAGRPLKGPTTPSASSPNANAALATSMPPLSPLKAGTPRSPHSPSRTKSAGPHLRLDPAAQQSIPQFYFPAGPSPKPELLTQLTATIDSHFTPHPGGLPLEPFLALVKDALRLPSVLGHILFQKLRPAPDASVVTREQFDRFWHARRLAVADPNRRMFEVLRKEGASVLTYDDFKPVLDTLLSTHPGLEFLRDTAEFQERYAETVVCRIFYTLSKTGASRLTYRELKRGDLLEAMCELDEEEDINKVLRYFSYEHFYVVYCKFWELDTDHDFLIDKEDLLRYGNHSLTYRVVEQIFAEVPRKFVSLEPGKMGYEDFIWFILSEEDKTTDTALEYWFRCIDLDGNGLITPFEMQHFYDEQLHRMECLSQEPVLFEDMVCQMHDMVQPERQGCYTLLDLKRKRLVSGTIFNVLFNLHKFIAFETRDPFLARQEVLEDPRSTDWDRFAYAEYIRLAMEEEGEEAPPENTDMWDDSLVI